MKVNQLKGGAALSYVNIFFVNVIGLLITPFIIRSLGTGEYGLYTMIGALIGYLTVLDFGLNNTIVRFIAKYRAEKDRKGEENFLAHSYLVYGFLSLTCIFLGFGLYLNFDSLYSDTLTIVQLDKAKFMFLILIFNLAITLPGGAFAGICSGYEEFVLPKVVGILRYVLRSALVVVVLIYEGDAVSLVILDTCMNLLMIAINGTIVFKKLKIKIKLHQFEWPLLKTMLGFSVWVFVFAMVHQLRWQFGQLILGVYYGTTVVGIFAVGVTLGNYYGAFSSAIASVFLPKAIQMIVREASREELTNMFIKVSRIILIVLLFILGAFVVIGKDFIYYWVGEEFDQAYYYAVIIMIGLTPTLSQGFAKNILEAKNLLSYIGWLQLSLTVIGTVIGIYMAKEYGVVEMILTTVVFILLERVIMINYYKKHANLQMGRYYKEIMPLFICVCIVLSVFLFVNHFLPERNLYVFFGNAIIYSIFYFITVLLFMTTYEKSLLKSILIKIPILKNVYR